MPVGHPTHQSADVAPNNVLYVPAEQLTGVVLASGQNCPVGHVRHDPADVWFNNGLYVPAQPA